MLGELLSNVYERKNRWMRNQRFLLACSLISLLLMIFEWKIVHSRYPDGPQNIYVFTIISSVTVFLYFMSCKGNCILGLIGKDHSSTIYVVHMMVYMTISIAKVLVYRFPNLFGKWCRPNYNSAVATFCNNIANGLEVTVNDRNTELELLYIDDLVEVEKRGYFRTDDCTSFCIC